MDLLLFFALPIATIILAVVFQKILKCPLLVAATFFAVYLILAFTAFDESFLVNAIVYTILAFIVASIVQFICRVVDNDGLTIRNLRANNIRANRIRTDTLDTNEIINNDNDDDNDDNNNSSGCGCNNRNRNCMCNSNNNRGYGNGINWYRR